MLSTTGNLRIDDTEDAESHHICIRNAVMDIAYNSPLHELLINDPKDYKFLEFLSDSRSSAIVQESRRNLETFPPSKLQEADGCIA